MTHQNLPKIHPRHDIVEAARRTFTDAAFIWHLDNNLTACEELEIITDFLHSQCQRYLSTERKEK